MKIRERLLVKLKKLLKKSEKLSSMSPSCSITPLAKWQKNLYKAMPNVMNRMKWLSTMSILDLTSSEENQAPSTLATKSNLK